MITSKKYILFLCTGNYYRSRFAEIYFNHICSEKKLPYNATSKGFYIDNPDNVGAISYFALQKLMELKIPIPSLAYPSRVTKNDFNEAKRIIALDKQEHQSYILKEFPYMNDKIDYWHIHDLYLEESNSALNKLKLQLDKELEYVLKLK